MSVSQNPTGFGQRFTFVVAFLRSSRQRWACSSCGGVVSMHDGICSECGRQYPV